MHKSRKISFVCHFVLLFALFLLFCFDLHILQNIYLQADLSLLALHDVVFRVFHLFFSYVVGLKSFQNLQFITTTIHPNREPACLTSANPLLEN